MKCTLTNRTIGIGCCSLVPMVPLVPVETLLITTNTSGVYLWVLDNPHICLKKKFVQRGSPEKKILHKQRAKKKFVQAENSPPPPITFLMVRPLLIYFVFVVFGDHVYCSEVHIVHHVTLGTRLSLLSFCSEGGVTGGNLSRSPVHQIRDMLFKFSSLT